MPDDEVLVSCQSASKRYCRGLKRSLWYGVLDIASEFRPGAGRIKPGLRESEFWAVEDVSFELKRGECMGLIGHNGAGKTTLLKMLNGLLKPDYGRIEMRGRVGALIALGAGFNPVLTARENIYTNAMLKGLTKREVDARIDEIIDFAEVAHAADAPVRTFSSGMQARLGFAIAAHLYPDILLIDEVLAVGDLSFRNKCLGMIDRVRENGGCYILVTHSFNQVMSSCPKSLLLENGRTAFFGDSSEAVENAIELQLSGARQVAERKDTKAESKERVSNGIVINSLRITGPDGGPVTSGVRALVELEVDAERDFDNVSWSFYIWNKDNVLRLVSKPSLDAGLTLSLRRGVSTLRAETGPLMLAPKEYSMRATVEVDGRSLDHVGYEGPPLWFGVIGRKKSVDDNRAYATNDIVVLDVQWSKDSHVPQ